MGKKAKTSKHKKVEQPSVTNTATEQSWTRVLAAANAVSDVLVDFQPFTTFNRNGVNVNITNAHPSALSSTTRGAIVALFEKNMKAQYEASDWGYDVDAKRAELFESEARYLLAYADDEAQTLVGFVHFRFVEDNEVEVLYIYEIQISEPFQRKGLGKFLMQLLLLVARKHGMKLVVLTVFKANEAAMQFYQKKLGFMVDETSPSACGDTTQSYEILSKIVDPSYC